MNHPSFFAQLFRRIAIVMFAALGMTLPFACSSADATCDGIEINGECQAACDPAKCAVPGSLCVNNACSAPCLGHEFCPVGQNCGSLPQGTFCYSPPFAADGSTGQFNACTVNEECDQARGFFCISGTCSPPCQTHSDCVDFKGYCKTDATGAGGCVLGEEQPPGQAGACTSSLECDQPGGYKCVDSECRLAGCRTHTDCAAVGLCKSGTLDTGDKTTACFADTVHPEGQYGTRCVGPASAMECDEANGFVCIGAGEGDVDAYCTGTACSAASPCPTGYFCSTVRTGRAPCAATCPGVDSEPANTNCVKAADIGAGKEYSCGPISLLRNLCLKSEYCNDCETDDDCRALPDQICAKDSKGKKTCTVICDPNVSGACPWGTASSCAVTDTDLNMPTCSHRFGTCKATGQSCEPCIDDKDCPGGLCLNSDFTQERYCLNLSVSCDCTGLPTQQNAYCLGGGCPKTPGGLNMRCFGGSAITADSLVRNRCYGAQIQQQFGGSPQVTCWPK